MSHDIRLINKPAYKGDWAQYGKKNWLGDERPVYVRHDGDQVIVQEDHWWGTSRKVYDKTDDMQYLR